MKAAKTGLPTAGGSQLLQSIFGNAVDQNFVGIPPIPQKKAEWMGHGSL
jgi:hypothetical protein